MASNSKKKKKSTGARREKSPPRISRREVESLSLAEVPRASKKSKAKPKKTTVTFWSLPKPVREKIYRLALVRQEALDAFQNVDTRAITRDSKSGRLKRMVPAWFEADHRVEKEAAAIFFGENRFDLDKIDGLHFLALTTWPRHLKLIRTLKFKYIGGTYERCAFLKPLQRMASLNELSIVVDEEVWLNEKLRGVAELNWHDGMQISPQISLRLYYFTGVPALLALSDIPSVNFLPDETTTKDAYKGPTAGGFFETVLKPHMMRRHGFDPESEFRDDASFRFLDLPAELRNRIYKELLVFPGGLTPSREPPSSVMGPIHTAPIHVRAEATLPDSVLKILTLCRQVHDEAAGIFYGDNPLTFHYPGYFLSFLLEIGPDRSRFIRELTLVHSNRAEGNTPVFDGAIRACRALRSLRKLHVLVPGARYRGELTNYALASEHRNRLYKKCTEAVEDIRSMFILRGLSEVKVRDLALERALEETSVAAGVYSKDKTEADQNLAEALERVNTALVLAQKGCHNKRYALDHRGQHSWWEFKVFPPVCNCEEQDRVCTDDPGTCLQLPQPTPDAPSTA